MEPESVDPPEVKNRYKGVRMRSWGKWVSEIRLPNSREKVWLGSYSTAEEAARAYDAAVVCVRGSSSSLNFPDTPRSRLPNYRCLSPRCLQQAAAEAAAAVAIDSPSSASRDIAASSNPPTNCHICSTSDNNTIDVTLQALNVTEIPNVFLESPTLDLHEVSPTSDLPEVSPTPQLPEVSTSPSELACMQNELTDQQSTATNFQSDAIFDRLQSMEEFDWIDDLAQHGLIATSSPVTSSRHRFDEEGDAIIEPPLWDTSSSGHVPP